MKITKTMKVSCLLLREEPGNKAVLLVASSLLLCFLSANISYCKWCSFRTYWKHNNHHDLAIPAVLTLMVHIICDSWRCLQSKKLIFCIDNFCYQMTSLPEIHSVIYQKWYEGTCVVKLVQDHSVGKGACDIVKAKILLAHEVSWRFCGFNSEQSYRLYSNCHYQLSQWRCVWNVYQLDYITLQNTRVISNTKDNM